MKPETISRFGGFRIELPNGYRNEFVQLSDPRHTVRVVDQLQCEYAERDAFWVSSVSVWIALRSVLSGTGRCTGLSANSPISSNMPWIKRMSAGISRNGAVSARVASRWARRAFDSTPDLSTGVELRCSRKGQRALRADPDRFYPGASVGPLD
ncbi:hypothetical protein [Saccharopolyspora flava]|uniref:hypothetical protein n=1 Tax=Saccharopolyspora flava TaxID=95161 RepID=UPI0015870B0F|nr:hypothetical protein [Saccharopolyspora flava]